MNKEHWNTIIIDEKVDEDLVKELIEQNMVLCNRNTFYVLFGTVNIVPSNSLKFNRKENAL